MVIASPVKKPMHHLGLDFQAGRGERMSASSMCPRRRAYEKGRRKVKTKLCAQQKRLLSEKSEDVSKIGIDFWLGKQ
jgi:hypothetical protein